MEEERSKCVIQRMGTILELGEEKAVIRINGKALTVSINKLSADDRSDEVKWSGNQWMRAKPERNKGNLERESESACWKQSMYVNRER